VGRFRPLFARIAATAKERDQRRQLPFEDVDQLAKAGIGTLRLPAEHGGAALGLGDLFRLLVELAEADPNFPQLLRAHYLVTESLLFQRDFAQRDRWLRLIGDGKLIGNAISERGSAAVGRVNTTVTAQDGRLLLNGTKYYTTGSLFADWIQVSAEHDGESVRVFVPASATGVKQYDDWNGFGQLTTSSGTIEFTDVEISAEDVSPAETGRTFRPAVAQLLLLACLVGIARRTARDATEYVHARRRSYSHASAALPKDDPLVQQVVGGLHSTSFAAEATLQAAVASVDRAQQAIRRGEPDEEYLDRAEIDVSRAQVVLVDQVLSAINRLFDVGGASIVDHDWGFDRHWRNARTIAVHNPVLYKARAIGDWAINGADPVYRWTPGTVA
jgi:alkylation response protein AidB-like acyl-CoA dehydrogenase